MPIEADAPALNERAAALPLQRAPEHPGGRPVRGRRRDPTPRVASALALIAGVVNLLSAAFPAEPRRLELVQSFLPGAVSRGATVATAAAGVGLLLLSGALRRRERLAALAALALLAGGAVLHLVKGLDVEEAVFDAFLAGLLLGRLDRFCAAVRRRRRSVLRPALAVLAVTFGYGLVGLVVNDRDVARDLGPLGLLTEIARMAVGLGAVTPLSGRFGRFFPTSLVVVCYTGLLYVAARALAPGSRPRAVDPELRAAVAGSDDSLAYFALRDDRRTVRAGDALVSYGTSRGVAVAAGDPLGPREQWPAAVAAFLREAADDGRVPAVMGCGAAAASVYAACGLHALYLGDEAVLDLEQFSLEGRAVRIARQSWNRARRAGYTTVICRSGELDADRARELQAMAQRWRGGAAERGFSMALNRLFDPRDAATVLVVAQDADARVRGFLHFVPWGSDGLSLDAMRRDRDAPAWLNDFLVVEAARGLRSAGIRRVSLNFSFLRAVLAAGQADGPWQARVARWVLRRLSGQFLIESLYRFTKKFDPSWQPRYGCLEAVDDLPRVTLAVLRLEGLVSLPALAGRRPGPESRG